MSDDDPSRLRALAKLIRARNSIDDAIADIIGRPALPGHVGEFIAATVFDIELERSAVQAGHDGRFAAGPFADRTVNVKLYGKREGLLDINEEAAPDFYPRAHRTEGWRRIVARRNTATRHRGGVPVRRPKLIEERRTCGAKVGVASSVPAPFWEEARIYPPSAAAPLYLSDTQLDLLKQFAG